MLIVVCFFTPLPLSNFHLCFSLGMMPHPCLIYFPPLLFSGHDASPTLNLLSTSAVLWA